MAGVVPRTGSAILVCEETASQLTETYFAGESLLFPEPTQDLALLSKAGEQCLLLLASVEATRSAQSARKGRRSSAKASQPSTEPVDLGAIRGQVQGRVGQRSERLVDLAARGPGEGLNCPSPLNCDVAA